MNTWIVGNHPVGHHEETDTAAITKGKGNLTKIPINSLVPSSKEIEQEEFGEKVFFMKGRIMAGQIDLQKSELGQKDYKWLTRDEIPSVVSSSYWGSIKNMLAER